MKLEMLKKGRGRGGSRYIDHKCPAICRTAIHKMLNSKFGLLACPSPGRCMGS